MHLRRSSTVCGSVFNAGHVFKGLVYQLLEKQDANNDEGSKEMGYREERVICGDMKR